MAHPHWLLKRVAKLEKDLVMQERVVAAYQIVLINLDMKGATKKEKKRLQESKVSVLKRLKKLEAKAELLKKVPELEIAYRHRWEDYK